MKTSLFQVVSFSILSLTASFGTNLAFAEGEKPPIKVSGREFSVTCDEYIDKATTKPFLKAILDHDKKEAQAFVDLAKAVSQVAPTEKDKEDAEYFEKVAEVVRKSGKYVEKDGQLLVDPDLLTLEMMQTVFHLLEDKEVIVAYANTLEKMVAPGKVGENYVLFKENRDEIVGIVYAAGKGEIEEVLKPVMDETGRVLIDDKGNPTLPLTDLKIATGYYQYVYLRTNLKANVHNMGQNMALYLTELKSALEAFLKIPGVWEKQHDAYVKVMFGFMEFYGNLNQKFAILLKEYFESIPSHRVGKEERFSARIEAVKTDGTFPEALNEEIFKIFEQNAIGDEFNKSWARIKRDKF